MDNALPTLLRSVDTPSVCNAAEVAQGSIGPSHGFLHVREIDTPVSVFGSTAARGDLVHADRHGGIVVPREIIPDLADAFAKMRRTEALVLEPARRSDFDCKAFEAAWAAFEKART